MAEAIDAEARVHGDLRNAAKAQYRQDQAIAHYERKAAAEPGSYAEYYLRKAEEERQKPLSAYNTADSPYAWDR